MVREGQIKASISAEIQTYTPDDYHASFTTRLKTKAREDFKLLLCDLNTCSEEQQRLLNRILFEQDGHRNTEAWGLYLQMLMLKDADSKPQLLRLVNKALEIIGEAENREDRYYVQIHLYSAQLKTDHQSCLHYYDFLAKKGIGKRSAFFYVSWVKHILVGQSSSDRADAMDVLHAGLEAGAEPSEMLRNELQKLSVTDEPEASAPSSVITRDSHSANAAVDISTSAIGVKRRAGAGTMLGKLSKYQRVIAKRGSGNQSEDEDNHIETDKCDKEDRAAIIAPAGLPAEHLLDASRNPPLVSDEITLSQAHLSNAAHIAPHTSSISSEIFSSNVRIREPLSSVSHTPAASAKGATKEFTASTSAAKADIHKPDLSIYLDDKLRNFDALAWLKRAERDKAAATPSSQSRVDVAGAANLPATANHVDSLSTVKSDSHQKNAFSTTLSRKTPKKTTTLTHKPFSTVTEESADTHTTSETDSDQSHSSGRADGLSEIGASVAVPVQIALFPPTAVKHREIEGRFSHAKDATRANGTGAGFSSYMSSIVDTSVLLDTSIMDTSLESSMHSTQNMTRGTPTTAGHSPLSKVALHSNSVSHSSEIISEVESEGLTCVNNAARHLDLSICDTEVIPRQDIEAWRRRHNQDIEQSSLASLLQRDAEIDNGKNTEGSATSAHDEQRETRRVSFAVSETGKPAAHVTASVASATGTTSIPTSQQHVLFDEKNQVSLKGKFYSRIGVLGKGGSSVVHRIMDNKGDIYAYKKVSVSGNDDSDSVFDSYTNEINLLQGLKGSKYIIELIDAEINREEMYIHLIMEAGEVDLSKVFKDRQAAMGIGAASSTFHHNPATFMNPFFCRMVWEQMLEAVDHIHEHRIVHGDLKPANFVFVKGQLKLIDFGIAKAISDHTTNIYRDSQIGTINYMAPEAIAPSSEAAAEEGPKMRLGRASDIWSLGCILYQMLYGRPPFAALNTIQKLHAIPNPKYDIMYPSTDDVDAVDSIRACLVRSPSQRARIRGENGLLSRDYLRLRSAAVTASVASAPDVHAAAAAQNVVAFAVSLTLNLLQSHPHLQSANHSEEVISLVNGMLQKRSIATTRPSISATPAPVKTSGDSSPAAPRRTRTRAPLEPLYVNTAVTATSVGKSEHEAQLMVTRKYIEQDSAIAVADQSRNSAGYQW